MRRFTIQLALAALLPTLSQAQFPDRVQSGARVRVWVPEPYRQEQGPWKRQQLRATVDAVVGDTLHLSLPGAGGTLAVPRTSIRRLDVSRGRPSRVASAVERAIGFAIAGAITVALDNDPGGSEWPNYRSDWRAAGEGAKWGAALGAVVGFALPTERWRRVRLNR
ncbi:MAG: hypothetical protein ACRENU_16095 [Gemmatimonadaceae bacterium]